MDSLSNELSNRTAVFGLKLWEVIGLAVAGGIVLILVLVSLLFSSKRRKKGPERSHLQIPNVSKEITVDNSRKAGGFFHPPSATAEEKTALKKEVAVFVQGDDGKEENTFDKADREYEGWRKNRPKPAAGRDVEMANRGDARTVEKGIPEGNKRGQHPCLDKGSSASGQSSDALSSPSKGLSAPEVSHLGWGHWFTLRELEMATDSFADSKVLGEGGYGIVYLGNLPDGTRIAVKNLLNNRGQAEREFKVEVEAIGRVRHKNLVRLIGYCMEGSQRMLVYEYVDSGNLAQWLHGPLGEKSPMSWDIRMKIILGTAKGLAYLHEGLEPKVVHRDVKSSNILIDSQWNAKVSDFGLAKLLGAENSHVTTRVMGTFGYVAPEYALTGMLTEKSDVYSYGVLVMELVTGRVPVDYGRPSGEVNLVDWLKTMIGNRLFDEVADPKMQNKPSPRALKRALLVALRCVDPDSQKRPKMGHIVHMLEAEDSPFRDSAVRSKNTTHGNVQANGHAPGDRRDTEPSDVAISKARWRYES